MKHKNKESWVREHFKQRCRERLGFELGIKETKRKIRTGELEFVERQSNARTKFRYIHEGIAYIIVYDKSRSLPLTILIEGGKEDGMQICTSPETD